ALFEHPNIVPLMVRRSDRAFAAATHERIARLLTEAGVPTELIVPLVDLQESLLVGVAVFEANADTAVRYDLDPGKHPALADAVRADRFDRRERLEMGTRALLNGWLVTAVGRELQSRPRRAAGAA